MKKNNKGFSLVEMMIVIAIVAVLVAVVVPIIGVSKNKAKGAVDAANIRTMMAEVATKRVSENDETKLLDGMSIVDSEITPNSNVLFYIVNENEVRAYYSTSLLFNNRLRGTDYNSAVADTGDLDSPYDILPDNARVLGAITSAGASVNSNTLAEAQNAEIEKVANAIAEGFFSLYGYGDDKTTEEKAAAITKLASDIVKAGLPSWLGGNEQFYANLKVAMMDSLMEEYNYDEKTAETMVASGDFIKDLTFKTGDSDLDKDLEKLMGSITADSFTKPKYSFKAWAGCDTTTEKKMTGCNHKKFGSKTFWYVNYTTTTYMCHGNKTEAEFQAYCDRYGLSAEMDCTAHDAGEKVQQGTKSSTDYAVTSKDSSTCPYCGKSS